MIPQITEINFGPNTENDYATLHQATCSFTEMGDRTISTQVRIDGDVVPDFSGWELLFKDERFVLPVREPQAAKDNTTRNSLVDLTFYSWPTLQMKRYFFFNLPSVTAGVAIPDQYVASVNLSIESFVQLFNGVLQYYFGSTMRMDLFSQEYDLTPVQVEINYSHIWDVLTKLYDIYGYRWRIAEESGVYVIKVNYPDEPIKDHDFEYGYQGGLLRFERQVQDDNINNVLLGRGGEKNLPYRYFKRYTGSAERPDTFPDDPDALYELKDIYFDRLRDINFRWYVRGWMQNSNRDRTWENAGYTYPQYTENDCPAANLFAFRKGKTTDTSFQPVEYVKDAESIEKYGERWGAVENNDEIFPTIQGLSRSGIGRIDETVAVSPIQTDDIEAAAVNAATENIIEGRKDVYDDIDANGTKTATFIGEPFVIPSGKTGNLTLTTSDSGDPYFVTCRGYVAGIQEGLHVTGYTLRAKNESTGEIVPGAGIPAGTYRYVAEITVENDNSAYLWITFGFNGIKLVIADEDANAWKPTFDIWVKNIWNTARAQGESDQAYSERVWLPILGDRVGNEAKLVFSTGPMSISQDYEFQIAAYPVPDQSKTFIDSAGNTYQSEWKITLRKSEAEFDATGLFIPNATQGGQPDAGDKFFFTGIDMPNMYVTEAEKRLNENKETQLDKSAEVNPTWAITLDKVRVHTLEDGEYGQTLAERLSAGCTVRTTDPRFTPGDVLVLYVQSLTYTWNEGDQVPNIEVVLADKVLATISTLQKLSGDVNYIRESYLKSSDLDAAVRRVASPLFLKKTGEADTSNSPTTFSSVIRSKNFRQGDIGGAGWGHYEDGDGDAVLELDKLVVRKEMRVNSLVVNQIAYMGGKQIVSAAAIECTQVIEDSSSYTCYFDQKQGTVANNFVVGDIAYGQTFDPDNTEVRYYRCVVSAVGPDYIVLVKAGKGGTGAPQKGDTIVQYGNTSNTARQYVIVRDVIGGGYERMLSGLSGTRTSGNEYYFAGRENGESPRWFVGSKANNDHYAEWANGTFTIRGVIVVTGGSGLGNMSEWSQVTGLQYLKDALPEDTTTQITNAVVLSSFIGVKDANQNIVAALNGSKTLPGFNRNGTIMFAAGITSLGDATNEATATTKIYESGKIVSGDVELSGAIVATSGKIGPFEVNSDNIKVVQDSSRYEANQPFGFSTIEESNYKATIGLVANDGVNWTQISSVQVGSLSNLVKSGPLNAVQVDFNRSITQAGNTKRSNRGMYLSVTGSGMDNEGIRILSYGGASAAALVLSAHDATGDNYAIKAEYGMFAGLRPKLLYTSATSGSNNELGRYDYNVIVSVPDATLKLPSSPEPGQTYHILARGGLRINFNGNGGYWMGDLTNRRTGSSHLISNYNVYVVFIWSGYNWYFTVHAED